MTKVYFANGQSIDCETVHSNPAYYNGTQRDKLTFVFPEEVSVQTVLDLFTRENCERIWLELPEEETGERYLHEHYTIRMGAGVKERGTLLSVAEDTDHRMVTYVEMIQTTYAEQQLDDLNDIVNSLLIHDLEV